ncbi:MAG: branched-chain amino acid ABC transporter permease [Chloroflexi bacterium]|nr:branched-chain amino acid ABC transporter permease [Chloroflexota bacterium]
MPVALNKYLKNPYYISGFIVLIMVLFAFLNTTTFMNCLMQTSLYLLIAMGLSIVFGIMHIINFAHGEFYMLGALVCYSFYGLLGLNYWLTIVLTMITIGMLGWIAQATVFRPFLGKFGGGLLIAIALGIVIKQATVIGWKTAGWPEAVIAPEFFKLPASIADSMAKYGLTGQKLAILIGSVLVVAFVILFIRYTKRGLSMRAVEQNQVAAQLQGIKVQNTARMAMFIGSALAGIAGCLIAPTFAITPGMGGIVLVRGLFIIIIGGMGTLWGIVLGAFVIGFTEIGVGALFNNPSMGTIAIFTVALAIFTIKPTGLLGHEYVKME